MTRLDALTVLLKALGVYFAVTGLAQLVHMLVSYSIVYGPVRTPVPLPQIALAWLSPGIHLAAGGGLLIGARGCAVWLGERDTSN